MGKLEKKQTINKALDSMPEPILDHLINYIKEIEEKLDEKELDDFILELNSKYSDLLSRLAK